VTTAPTPDLRALADRLEDMTCLWSPSNNRDLVNNAAIELRRLQADNERLRGKVGRFQGVPLPLIEAINAATGSNDWQGEAGPDALLEPACHAIEAMRAERPMPTVEDASQDWDKVDPITAWHLIERHADNWADIGKMMSEYVQAQIARAELEARKPLPLSIERLDELWASQRSFHGGEPLKMGHVEFARLIEVEYGVLGRIPMREENGGQIDPALVDKSPNLQEPLVDKTANLQDRPAPLSDDERLRLRSDVARAIWDVMREHEDRCDHALEDVEPKHQVWDCADAAIKAVHGITGGSS
jgi:hypothetical protein